GCGSEPRVIASQPQVPASAGPELASEFDPTTCGTVTGLVTWTGPIPDVPPVQYIRPRKDGSGYDTDTLTLPNAPRVDWVTRGLEGAVVCLRGVNPTQARPWNLPPVSVEFRERQLLVIQGDRAGRTGFVRRGTAVSMQSTESDFHILRARGSAFFSLAFPDPHQPLSRPFDHPGRVELSSGAGFYWQSADLFICEHPYFAVTNAEGRFSFSEVPAGKYELVAWHPNWVITRTERNPESGLPNRLHYASALETARPVVVAQGRVSMVNLNLPK
ncbi:MAG: carboxypeptidase-like regulatory domain-containing protein, partial [Planctomycetia bacterium]|nr:carboxypeptidase-like regulatory domain-containing protein [Planctomycetia bacterium]